MCIGNRDEGDDAVGPYIADNLNKKFTVLDCGMSPENFTSAVKKYNPKNLIIIDAVEMNLKPGEIRIVPKEKIGVMTMSTHGIPLSLLINYLEKHVEKIIFIGIQPEIMSGNMTGNIKKSADKLIKIIKREELEKIKIIS
ncbi:MAG: hydrogenase maturation peptidase HycI [Thermoplasmatales archaeon]|nr:MAG: hydrogenase maturation peptidase HycI [Thermoplasmatales archaeon]